MLRRWWLPLFCVGALLLAVLLFYPNTQSTLAQEEKIRALKNDPHWGDELLLPTSLPGTAYVREALVTEWTEQRVEFLQDGYWVQIGVNLPESTFAKEELIQMARSFRAF